MRLVVTALALVALTGCAAPTASTQERKAPQRPAVGDPTTAEVMCEKYVVADLGINDPTFMHQATSAADAPDYTVIGSYTSDQGAGQYRCELTYEGDDWTLTGLTYG